MGKHFFWNTLVLESRSSKLRPFSRDTRNLKALRRLVCAPNQNFEEKYKFSFCKILGKKVGGESAYEEISWRVHGHSRTSRTSCTVFAIIFKSYLHSWTVLFNGLLVLRMKIEKNKIQVSYHKISRNKHDKQTINETEQRNKQSVLKVISFGHRNSLTGSKS